MAGRQAGLCDVTTQLFYCPSELNNSLVTKVEPYKNRKIMQIVCVALQLFVAL